MKTSLPLRKRLFLNYLIVLLMGMGLATLLAWRSVESLYLETQRENLLAQARLTAASLQGQPLPGITQSYTQETNALPGIHSHLLAEQDAVVYKLPVSSEKQPVPPAEDIASISSLELQARTEIKLAMQGNPSTSIRKVIDRRVLYAAAPIVADDGDISGLVYLAMPLPDSGLPASLLLKLTSAGLVAVILSLIAGTLLANKIVFPMEAIASAVSAISAGNLNQHLTTDSEISELNELGQTFNKMTESLRQADQVKNSFIADVTHELRTPLTVIKGTIETLEDGAMDDLNGRGALINSMLRETDRLIRLVNDLLVLSRASNGTLNIEIQPIDLADLARARCSHFSSLASHRDIQLVVNAQETSWALGDVDRLSQVLDNLLDNAIRYSQPGSIVSIEIKTSSNECHCAVCDNGAGIAKQHLPFIFDRFYRADTSRNRQTGGAGLGLAIVRALVLAQSGRISAESQEGLGTTISFSLPAIKNCHPID